MNVLAECGGNRLQRFIRFLFKKKGTFSEWQTSECTVFWVESCVSGTDRDVDVDVQVNVCLSEAEAAPCPLRLSQMAHLFFIASSTKNYTTAALAPDASWLNHTQIWVLRPARRAAPALVMSRTSSNTPRPRHRSLLPFLSLLSTKLGGTPARFTSSYKLADNFIHDSEFFIKFQISLFV